MIRADKQLSVRDMQQIKKCFDVSIKSRPPPLDGFAASDRRQASLGSRCVRSRSQEIAGLSDTESKVLGSRYCTFPRPIPSAVSEQQLCNDSNPDEALSRPDLQLVDDTKG